MIPLAVLIPTRNVMPMLPGHLESMRPWLDLAQEIVVVDSASRDGTRQYLAQHLPQARHLQHPPGLYASWNFGISQVQAPYLYISTVGDSITRAGLLHLYEVAQRRHADVVVSPPDFIDEAGRPVACNNWPIHDMVATLNLREQDICLQGLSLFLVALAHIPFAVLGSCASNLFRTQVLQQNPFRTDYGRNGDGAWGLLNALHIRLALTPRRISTFRHHRVNLAPGETNLWDGDQRMLEEALTVWADALKENALLQQQAAAPDVDGLIQAKGGVLHWRTRLQALRRRRWVLWYLSARAWYARQHREAAQKRCLALLANVLRHGAADAPAPGAAITAGTETLLARSPVV